MRTSRAEERTVKTQDALSLLIALEERVARVYFHFFRTFREDGEVARCWWDMARDEYGHVGILKMARDLVSPEAEAGQIGARLWSLVDVVEGCEQEAASVDSLARALELAIQLESSELDALGHRIIGSLRSELPEQPAFAGADDHVSDWCRPLEGSRFDSAQRLETMLGAPRALSKVAHGQATSASDLPRATADQPAIWTMSQEFDSSSIRQADLDDGFGWIMLELEGMTRSWPMPCDGWRSGVIVAPIEQDVVAG
jgi:hypothetical protein